MRVLVKVVERSSMTSFQSEKTGDVIEKLEVRLAQGGDEFVATAFDKVAKKVCTYGAADGLFVADLQFGISNGKEGKVFQNVRVVDLMPF